MPLRPLTAAAAAGIGEPIRALADAQIRQVRWRAAGRRPLTSGGYGSVVEGPFEVFWEGDELRSRNAAIGREDVLGRARRPGDRTAVLIDEVNYHDDAGQAFIGPGTPTVFLAAPPGDDVAPGAFVALYSDGGLGLNLVPGAWHTAPLPMVERATYENKQGSVHATVALRGSQEWGVLLEVPLVAPG